MSFTAEMSPCGTGIVPSDACEQPVFRPFGAMENDSDATTEVLADPDEHEETQPQADVDALKQD